MKNLRHQSVDFSSYKLFPKHSYHKSETFKSAPKNLPTPFEHEEAELLDSQRQKRTKSSLKKSLTSFFSSALHPFQKSRKVQNVESNPPKTKNEEAYFIADLTENRLEKRTKRLWGFIRRKVFFPIQLRQRCFQLILFKYY